MSITSKCVESYSRLKHLKLVGEEIGIPWQTVYVHLKKAGVSVTGDKARYGSASDRLANKAEAEFQKTIPWAKDNNKTEFQSSIDFNVDSSTVDIKASRLKFDGKLSRWAFCVNKQRDDADFFVLYAYDEKGCGILHLFLIPGEIAREKTTISITESLNSKWADYIISSSDMVDFFNDLKGF